MRSSPVKMAAVAGLIVLLLAIPLMPLTKYQLHLINLIVISGILAMSLDLLFGFLGQMSLAHASFYGIGAYASALLTIHGIPFWIAAPLAMVLCGAVGFGVGIPTMRLTGFYLAMATMSFSIIMSTLFVQSVDITGGPNGLLNIPSPRFFGTELFGPQRGVSGNYYYLLIACGIFTYAFIWRLTSGRLGRAIVGVRESAPAAASVGINVRLVQVAVFALSCMFAGLAGSLYAHLILYISPETFTFGNSLLALLAVVLGGIGTIWGPLVGAAILTWLGEAMRQFGAYQLVIYACALLLVISLIPHGVSGLLTSVVRRKLDSTRSPSPDDAHAEQLAPPTRARVEDREAVLLEVEGVSRRFGGVHALSGVSFKVRSGEIKAVIGPNGSGKSTLFNVISGFDRANRGSVRFGERAIAGLPPYKIARSGMARSFQVVQLFGRMSVRENLLLAGQRCHDSGILSSLLGLKTNAVADRRNAAAADWLLNEAGLYAQRHKPAATLPYGRQRILEVARALATQPKLILLDEPAAGLNTGEAFELADYLRKIRNRGVTILVVEHNMPFVLGLADSIVVLDSGQKIADDVPDVIQCDERVIASYLGTPAPEAIDA